MSNKQTISFAKTIKPTVAALGATTSAEKTYTSLEGKYTVTYPGSWLPSELPSDSSASGIPVFTVGPVGKKILGYPSFIQIITLDNPQNLSLHTYMQQNFDTAITFTPIQIASYSAEKTTNIPSSVPTDSYFIANNIKIYEIRWFHGSDPKITDVQFQKFLTSLSFQ